MEACLKMEICFSSSNYISKVSKGFLEDLHYVRDSHLGTQKTKFGSMCKLWIKGNSRFEMNQHEVLMKSNQTSRGFYTKYWILRQQVMLLFRTIQNIQIKKHWWVLNLERNQLKKITTAKKGIHSMNESCIISKNAPGTKNVKFISNWHRKQVSIYVSTLYQCCSHSAVQV